MSKFVEGNAVEMVCAFEGSEGRHADEVLPWRIVCLACTLADDCPLDARNSSASGSRLSGLRMLAGLPSTCLQESFALGDVKDVVFAQHWHKLFECFPLFGFSDAKLLDE